MAALLRSACTSAWGPSSIMPNDDFRSGTPNDTARGIPAGLDGVEKLGRSFDVVRSDNVDDEETLLSVGRATCEIAKANVRIVLIHRAVLTRALLVSFAVWSG